MELNVNERIFADEDREENLKGQGLEKKYNIKLSWISDNLHLIYQGHSLIQVTPNGTCSIPATFGNAMKFQLPLPKEGRVNLNCFEFREICWGGKTLLVLRYFNFSPVIVINPVKNIFWTGTIRIKRAKRVFHI